MLRREDRRLFGIEDSDSDEENSDDNEPQEQPEPPPNPNPDTIFNDETEIPVDNPHFRVFCKKIPFRRVMRYGFADSQFEIRFRKVPDPNNNRETEIPALNCIQMFRAIIVYVIKSLRQRFHNMECCYVFFTLASPMIIGGIPIGGRCLFGSLSEIENAFLIRVWRFLNTNQNMPLDENMTILIKTLCDDRAAERQRDGTLPDRGHTHEINREINRGLRKVAKQNKDDPASIKDPPSYGVFWGNCLLLALIMARAKAISMEKRPKKPHPDDICWEKIRKVLCTGANSNSAHNKLRAQMFKMKQILNLNGTTLQEVIPKFCNHFGDMDCFVICPEFSLRKFKYSYPETGSELNQNYKIFLYQEKVVDNEFHIKYIDYIKTYADNNGGLECIFGCKTICMKFQYPHAKCRHAICDVCHYVIDPNKYFEEGEKNLMEYHHCDGKKNMAFECPNCNFVVGSEKCKKRHKTIRCGKKKTKCKGCGIILISESQKDKHECGVIRCFKCEEPLPRVIPKTIYELDAFEAIHQCPYKRAKIPSKLPNIGFFTLAIGQEIGCKICLRDSEECSFHENYQNAVKMTSYAAVRLFN